MDHKHRARTRTSGRTRARTSGRTRARTRARTRTSTSGRTSTTRCVVGRGPTEATVDTPVVEALARSLWGCKTGYPVWVYSHGGITVLYGGRILRLKRGSRLHGGRVVHVSVAGAVYLRTDGGLISSHIETMIAGLKG